MKFHYVYIICTYLKKNFEKNVDILFFHKWFIGKQCEKKEFTLDGRFGITKN